MDEGPWVKTRRYGATWVDVTDGAEWYVVVTPPFAAVCHRHGTPHLHRHPVRGHPDHAPAIPLPPGLTLADTLDRLRFICTALPRGLEFEELLEALR